MGVILEAEELGPHPRVWVCAKSVSLRWGHGSPLGLSSKLGKGRWDRMHLSLASDF